MENYFYHIEEIKLNAYYRFPKELLMTNKYKSMNDKAKILYMILLDRVSLSIENNWADENGNVFIIFSREEAINLLGVSEPTIAKLFEVLVDHELIWDRRLGRGKANRIYVKKLQLDESETLEFQQRLRNFSSRTKKTLDLELKKVKPSNTNINNTYLEIESVSRSIPEIEKLNKNNKFENIESKESISQSVQTENKQDTKRVSTDLEKTTYTNNIEKVESNYKKQINYNELQQVHGAIVDEVLNNMVDMYCSYEIIVEKEKKPQMLVRHVLSKVTSKDVELVIKKISSYGKEIKNKKGFIRSTIFNSIHELESDVRNGKRKATKKNSAVPQMDNYDQREYEEEYLKGFYANLD